jgi:hypothetical protein
MSDNHDDDEPDETDNLIQETMREMISEAQIVPGWARISQRSNRGN